MFIQLMQKLYELTFSELTFRKQYFAISTCYVEYRLYQKFKILNLSSGVFIVSTAGF
jgi:hypothetical protein